MKQEFNLIDEPWICVRTADCQVQEVGLRSLLLHAEQYKELAGETKTQDFAVLRLILALMYTIFSRYDDDGNAINLIDDPALAIDRWEAIWQSGHIPEVPVNRYFEEWYDRFWLFDPQHPFFQSNAVIGKGKTSTAKMIGSLFESNNKSRLFSDHSKEGRALSYAEAARWLLHLNSFDDIAAKQPTPKRTWSGKLSMIALEGNQLFETIMLNYRADYDANKGNEEHPSWESDESQVPFNRQIPIPDNQAALLSIRSRQIYLIRENGLVQGYYLAGGDYFEADQVFDEQMTLWKGHQDKKDSPYVFKPRRYDTTKQIWQEFASISEIARQNHLSVQGYRAPGVVEWLHELLKMDILSRDFHAKVCTAAVIYDYNQATSLPVIDSVSDSLTFHVQLLGDIGAVWRERVIQEIGKCDDAAKAVFGLYKNLQFANGRRDKDNTETQSGELDAKREYYTRIDRLFRLWLAGLDPQKDMQAYSAELECRLRKTALSLGKELTVQNGENSVFGRGLTSSASVLNIFESRINKIFILAKTYSPGGEKI